ncbi:MAG TPA: thiamine pyrophosphate-dependent enzyme [Candidatus Thermoplasmatota archaeon]|nr:thiamine pyrophosphate-dependent enzyme [Candidatus Thermoplasmatota archaeon]
MAAINPIPVTAYKVDTKPTWCPGCGDYAVLTGVTRACATTGTDPKDLVVVSGIGCSSNLPHFLKAYGMHTLHGRSIPVATGVKLANPNLKVVITGGDGDGYGIGIGHMIHAMRRNLDVTYVVMNNEIYGLTTGQTSPTSLVGMNSKSTPTGNIENPVNPLGLALFAGATFVARAFSGDAKHLADIIQQGIEHKGFSLVDVQSPCVTYNKLNTYDWFRERVYKLEESGHNPADFGAAADRASEWPTRDPHGKVPIGVFYKAEGKPTYEEQDPALSRFEAPALQRDIKIKREAAERMLAELL